MPISSDDNKNKAFSRKRVFPAPSTYNNDINMLVQTVLAEAYKEEQEELRKVAAELKSYLNAPSIKLLAAIKILQDRFPGSVDRKELESLERSLGKSLEKLNAETQEAILKLLSEYSSIREKNAQEAIKKMIEKIKLASE